MFASDSKIYIWFPWELQPEYIGVIPKKGVEVISRSKRNKYSEMDTEAGFRLTRDGWLTSSQWRGENIDEDLKVECNKRIARVGVASKQWITSLDSPQNRTDFTTRRMEHRVKIDHSNTFALHMTRGLSMYKTVMTYTLRQMTDGAIIPMDIVAQADWDQRGRLVSVSDGRVYAADIQRQGVIRQELADFNENTFSELEAPHWPKQW